MRPFDSKDAYRLKKFVQERDRELSLAWDGLSPQDRSLALSLLEQARGLRKVCPAQEWECLDRCKINGASRNADGDFADHMKACNGTGSLPVTAEDVEVRVK